MKIKDILIESHDLTEAPVGMLKRAGLGIASKFGSDSAKGALDTATTANGLKKAYSRFLGQSGQKPNADNILAFLNQNGLPTDGAQTAIQQAASASGVQLAPAKDMKSALGIGKNAGKPMATQNDQEPEIDPNQPFDASGSAQEPGGDITDYDTPAYQRKGIADPKIKPMTATDKLKMDLKAGRGLGKATGSKFKSAVQAGKDKGLNMSRVNSGTPVMEVELKTSTVDKIILAAVQDAVKNNMGQQLSAVASGEVSAGAAPSSGGGAMSKFAQGFKKGLTGQDSGDADKSDAATLQGNVNYSQLAQILPGVDPKTMAMVINRIKQGKEPSVQQMAQLGSAFVALLKADPQSKQQAINLLKKMQTG
jgi:hypothetical protein